MRNKDRLLLVSLLISAGLYSASNARLYVQKLPLENVKKLVGVLKCQEINLAEHVVVGSEGNPVKT